jgi:DNA helicase-2/ATP-dependent DNA helicase PcrA
MHPQRYYFHPHHKSDRHSFSQRTRFIPDELLPYFAQVNAGKSKQDSTQGATPSDVTTADVRRKIGRMWA